MEKILSLLVIDSLIFDKNNINFNKKIKKNKSYRYFKLRIIEHVINFIKLNYLHCPGKFIFFLFVNGSPFSFISDEKNFESQGLKIKKGLKILVKFFREKLQLTLIDGETEKIKISHKPRNFLLSLNSVFFIIHCIREKFAGVNISIFGLVFKKNSSMNQNGFTESLSICRKLDCNFSFLIFNKDVPFFRFLSLFSNGFYGEPVEKLGKIVYCNKFIQLLLRLFWINKIYRELCLRSIQTKPAVFNHRFSFSKNTGQCSFCNSIFTSTFSNCIVCGSKYLFRFN